MSAPKPCMVGDCDRPKRPGKHKCEFHWLLSQSPDIQFDAANARRARKDAAVVGGDAGDGYPRARVSKKLWPEGERWCAGCQGYVPLFYCTGSQCKAHAAMKSHAYRLEKIYGISAQDYADLMEFQGGVCYICGRKSNTKRLAVDHDHITGRVRGLLCPDNERGCNHAIIGNIRDIDMARRIVAYLENPPYDQLRGANNGRGKLHAPAARTVLDLRHAKEQGAPGGAGEDHRGATSIAGGAGAVSTPDQVRDWRSDPEWQF